MVRLKSRYILFEILYPPIHSNNKYENLGFTSVDDVLLHYHQMSSPTITYKSISQELRRVLQVNFGGYGVARATNILQVKYFSNKTSTGILRCSREDYELVIIALTFMTKLGNVENIIVNPVKISGTIKKIEQFAIRRNKQLAFKFNRTISLNDFENVSEDDANE
ncbi:RNA-binding protein POP5 Ecym_5058 [Eremothecium cymbalariae DBVPG|uniref:Ribonuclease P/MRP protein subunit POP5 n=1 Tax=Eremothecium cymbalariae (strain CBS 270.75 / DBVPG 7215 / KCTC 17166 / NRRL Y-17582) TaxID=931890 RepID=I6NCQ6_ERECY|nr:hypothetical protein Ecym_5058 [Eremothecium cymbalariae DBVPG\